MILNDEQLAHYNEETAAVGWRRDCLDTIADLKRQLAEAQAQLGLWGYERCKEQLDAYVQEHVDWAVLAESEAWNEQGCLIAAGEWAEARLASNRAKVKP